MRDLFPQPLPEFLNGVQFWRIRGQIHEGNRARVLQILCLVPSCLIHSDNDFPVGVFLGEFIEEDIHHAGIYFRQEEGKGLTRQRCNTGVEVEILISLPDLQGKRHASLCPYAHKGRLKAKPPFIEKEEETVGRVTDGGR